ncbi:MAG: YfhO family protein, partial [Chloroflexi bacterium]|nr:YfhO family protein [Chloroflexota bacterium]
MNLILSRLVHRIKAKPGDSVAIFLLIAWPFIYFFQAALRQVVFYFGDIYLFFYPVRTAMIAALREGRLPLWAPEMMSGYPLFAEGQVAALYPPNLFLYLFLPIDLATNYAILLHLAWVALGMYFFLRALQLQPASAFLGAFAFACGGFFYARLVHLTILATAAWLPWIFWAWEKFERATDRTTRVRWFALLGALSAVQLVAGHPQFALFTAALLGAYSVVRWNRNPTAPRKNFWSEFFAPTRIGPVLFFFAIGALIAGAQLAPTLELTALSNRASGLLPKFFNAYSLRLPHYLMLFAPFLLGNPYPLVSVETIGYIGLLPILFAMCAPLVVRDRRVVFFSLVALVSLFLALGDQNFFYRALRYLPGLNFFRVPSRFFFLFSFSAALLAAITLEYFLQRAKFDASALDRKRKTLYAVCVIFVALVVGLAPSVSLELFLSLWNWLPLFFFFVTLWIILIARRGLLSRQALVAVTLTLTVIDLALFAAVYAKTYNATTSVADFYKVPDSLAAIKNVSPQDGRVFVDPWIEPWLSVERESLFSNLPLLYGFSGVRAYSPLLLQRNDDYIENMSAPMLNLANVRYYLRPQLLPTNPVIEGNDLRNEFGLDLVGYGAAFAPTPTSKIRIASSMAQSTGFATGQSVATIQLILQDGSRRNILLRAGIETAEWAYERSDVRAQTQHALPKIATTFPASSAFPIEKHLGHNFFGEWDIARDGKPVVLSGILVDPIIARGLLHIERVELIAPDGAVISLAHLLNKS